MRSPAVAPFLPEKTHRELYKTSCTKIKDSTVAVGPEDGEQPPGPDLLDNGRALCFGDVVVFQNSVTGMVTAPFILRCVEGRASAVENTICEEKAQYTYWIPPIALEADPELLAARRPLGRDCSLLRGIDPFPIPVVYTARRLSPSIVQLQGVDFTQRLSCFVGGRPVSRTKVVCPEILEFELEESIWTLDDGDKEGESDQAVSRDGAAQSVTSGRATEPLLLVRDDGVVYRTGNHLTIYKED
ncbi:hypothetical protein HK405_006720 [Cladochytrium tenue]|nr:hypothetical protein HK405_006720 [Cladochytrium tenue]